MNKTVTLVWSAHAALAIIWDEQWEEFVCRAGAVSKRSMTWTFKRWCKSRCSNIRLYPVSNQSHSLFSFSPGWNFHWNIFHTQCSCAFLLNRGACALWVCGQAATALWPQREYKSPAHKPIIFIAPDKNNCPFRPTVGAASDCNGWIPYLTAQIKLTI